MVVVDVAGFQAMWLASRCSDLYMKRARRCFKCTNQLLEKCWRQLFEVQEGVLYGATSLKCPTHPGAETSLRLLQRDRRKWGKRGWLHTLQCPCAQDTGHTRCCDSTAVSEQQCDKFLWLHLTTVIWPFLSPELAGQRWTGRRGVVSDLDNKKDAVTDHLGKTSTDPISSSNI